MTEILIDISYALAVVLLTLSFFLVFLFPLLKMVQLKKEAETMARLLVLLSEQCQKSREEAQELREKWK